MAMGNVMSAARSAPELVWLASGSPLPRWPLEPARGLCATCGVAVTAGVAHERINSETFSQQGDFFQYGTHVCPACAWFYSDAKQRHRSVLAAGDWVAWPLISLDAAATDGTRPSWLAALRQLATLSPNTPTTGVFTTDPKPRLWPRMRLGTAARPALYVHAPDYDISRVVRFDVARALAIAERIILALELGFTKRAIWRGLWRDHRRLVTVGEAAVELERQLAGWRADPAFIPALLAAGRRKEETHDPRNTARDAQPTRATGSDDSQNIAGQLQLC